MGKSESARRIVIFAVFVLAALLACRLGSASTSVHGDAPLVGDKDLEAAKRQASYPTQSQLRNAVGAIGCAKIESRRQAPDCTRNQHGYWFCRGVTDAWCEVTKEAEDKAKQEAKEKERQQREARAAELEKERAETARIKAQLEEERRRKRETELQAATAKLDADRRANKSPAGEGSNLDKQLRALDEKVLGKVSGTAGPKSIDTAISEMERSKGTGKNPASPSESLAKMEATLADSERARIAAERKRREEQQELARQAKRKAAEESCKVISEQSCKPDQCGKEPDRTICTNWRVEYPSDSRDDRAERNETKTTGQKYLSLRLPVYKECTNTEASPHHARWESCTKQTVAQCKSDLSRCIVERMQ
jgi:hypothetical protein